MKNRGCPNRIACYDYDASNCEGCAVGNLIIKLKKKIKGLQVENANLNEMLDYRERCTAKAERALKEFAAYTGCTSCPYEQRCPDAPIPPSENNYKKCVDNYLTFAEKDLMEE